MAQNYTVNYTINVQTNGALGAMRRFSNATKALTNAAKNFQKLTQSVNSLSNNLGKLQAKTYTVNIDTTQAHKKVNSLSKRLSQLKEQLQQLRAMGLSLGPVGGGGGSKGGKSGGTTVFGGGGRGRSAFRRPSNLGYKTLGPTPLDVGGIGAINFLKGMGIAYGIAGAGTLISNMVKDAVAYDNSMQTVKNIIGSHDVKGNFQGRFKAMERTVRNVGMKTKFTAPQVADAAKFLAMAGFDIEAINASILPIADIALIGDTDIGETADVVTNIMTGYGIDPNRVRHAADIMTNTFTMSNTTLMEMAEAYKYSASLLSAGGIDFEESTAALGILGNAGIKGSQAGTTLRTIMANIVNPTKKQLANWERIGIARMDSNGQVRDLADIFGDLANANLTVADFYKLFHKTAAQGAVALANHVDDWNKIIMENFMSEGLSKELAEAKKQTIQGLWAQLTSAFTENGLRAFENVQSPIRSMLEDAINWFTPPEDGSESESTKMFKALATDLMDFVKQLKDATIWIIKLMSFFKPFIKMWFTFQLYMWPVLTGLRVFKAAILGVMAVGKLTGTISLLAGKFVHLGSAISMAKKQAGGFWKGMGLLANSGVNNFTSYWRSNFIAGMRGKEVTPEVWARYQRMQAYRQSGGATGGAPVPVPNAPGFGLRATMKGIGGMVAGGLAGHAIGEAVGGDTGAMIGGILGGVLLPFLLSAGPYGWAAAGVIALGGLVAAWYNSAEAAAKAATEAQNFVDSITMVDGVLVGDGISRTEQYLNLMYNKHLDINDAIATRIELLKEELNLQNPEKVTSDDNSINKKVFDKAVSVLDATDSLLNGSGEMAQFAADKANAFGRNMAWQSPSTSIWYWRNNNGNFEEIRPHDMAGGMDAQDALAAMSALYSEGISGSQQNLIKTEFKNRLAYILSHNGTLEDILAVKQDWWDRYASWTYDRDKGIEYFNYDLDDIKNWDAATIARSYTYNQGLYDSMSGIYGSNAPVWQAAQNYWNGVQTDSLTEDAVVQYLSMMDGVLGGLFQGYVNHNLEEWQRTLGYWDGTFHAMNGHDALTVAQTTHAQLEALITTIGKLDTPAQNATANLLLFASQLNSLANGYIWTSNGGKAPAVGAAKDGAIETVNGQKYKYDQSTDSWQQLHPDGTPNIITLPIKDAAFQGMKASYAGNDGQNGGAGGAGGNGSGGGGAHPSKYKTHYDNSSAAPKQIIVNIDKLMSVDKVDLADPNKAQAIAEFKAEFVPVILDVLHNAENYM